MQTARRRATVQCIQRQDQPLEQLKSELATKGVTANIDGDNIYVDTLKGHSEWSVGWWVYFESGGAIMYSNDHFDTVFEIVQ